MKPAVAELVGHAKRVASEQANGAKSGREYAAGIITQAETFRVAATLLEAEGIRALVMARAEKLDAAEKQP